MRGAALAHGDVALDGVVEKHGVLRHDAHVFAHALLRIVAQRDPVDADVARRGVVEPRQQFAQRRLAAARGTHQRHGLPAEYLERNAFDHLARTVVGEMHVAEFDFLLQARQLFGVGGVLYFGGRVDDREDAFAGGDALVDVGELVDEGAHGARDLREDGHEGDESAGIEGSLGHERAAEDEDHAHGRDAQKFAHRRRQLLAAGHREGQPRQVGADGIVFLLDVFDGVVALDDFDARERFVERGDHFTHALLVGAGRVAEFLDDAADQQRHHREEQHREDRQLPRNGHHHHDVADDEERLAERHLQCVGDAELHDAHVGGDFRDDVAFALVREIAHVHVHHAREHLVAHTLERPGAHILHGPGAQITEQVAQQADADGHHGQQQQYVLRGILLEDMRIGEIEECGQILLVQLQGRQFLDILERVVRVEHGVQDRDDQHERQRVEQRVEKGVEKVGNGVFLDRPGEAQQPHICLEHSGRMVWWLRNNRNKGMKKN